MGQTITKSILLRFVNFIFLFVFLSINLGFTDTVMTDDQKKQRVYDLYEEYRKDFPAVVDISPSAAMVLLEEKRVIFIDIRDPEERAISMLPGAIDRDTFQKAPNGYEGKTLVAYCTVGYRSGVFAKEMGERGINVRNLSGGIVAWVLEGGKIYDEKGETRRIHVYKDKWNFAPEGYEVIVFGFLKKMLKN